MKGTYKISGTPLKNQISVSSAYLKVKGMENLFDELIENFPSLGKEVDIQVREAFRTPNRHDQKRTSPQHIIVKLPKILERERILKFVRCSKSHLQVNP